MNLSLDERSGEEEIFTDLGSQVPGKHSQQIPGKPSIWLTFNDVELGKVGHLRNTDRQGPGKSPSRDMFTNKDLGNLVPEISSYTRAWRAWRLENDHKQGPGEPGIQEMLTKKNLASLVSGKCSQTRTWRARSGKCSQTRTWCLGNNHKLKLGEPGIREGFTKMDLVSLVP